MKLAVVGSRRRDEEEDKQLLKEFIIKAKPDELVSGGCPKGGDKFAEEIAEELNIPIKIFYPELPKEDGFHETQKWEYTKAYYARDDKIAEYCDAIVALVAFDRKGGTERTLKKAKKLGKNFKLL